MSDTRLKCLECDGRGTDEWGGTCIGCGGQGRQPFREWGKEADEDYANCQHYGVGHCFTCGCRLDDEPTTEELGHTTLDPMENIN